MSEKPSAKNYDNEIDITSLYLSEIGRYSLLTRADERELAIKIEQGAAVLDLANNGADSDVQFPAGTSEHTLQADIAEGKVAKEAFILANLRLVVSIAKRYVTEGMGLMDLIQEGNLGLMHAVDMFDYKKGFKFSTYATWWIRQNVVRSRYDKGSTIRVPVHLHEKIVRYERMRWDLDTELKGKALEEIEIQRMCAERMRMPLEKIQELALFRDRLKPESLDAAQYDDNEESSLYNLVPGGQDDFTERLADRSELDNMWYLVERYLSPVDTEVMICCHRDGLSNEKAAEVLGLSVGNVRSAQVRSLKTIRSIMLDRAAAESN